MLAAVPARALVALVLFVSAVGGSAAYPGGRLRDPGPPAALRPQVPVVATPSVERQIVPDGIRGIDVSHYQGRIDWRRVAASGQHFAIAKATEGRTYIDRTYDRNRVLAQRYGIVFGAYHFARPDRGTHDAVREANHFLDVAGFEPGNMIPVLDLETTGGLSRERLTRWMLTWLDRVQERLGVRPIVYTSPVGWELRTGDTTAIAEAGYELLWVAHWGVPRPTLPARDWAGHGFALWQRSACGSVPGIKGCVDMNVVVDRSLTSLTITEPDRRAPSVRVSAPRDLTSGAVVRFDEVVDGVTATSVVVTAAGRVEDPAVRVACRTSVGVVVDCGSGDARTVTLTPLRPLVPGATYEVTVNATATTALVADVAGNLAPATSRRFTAPVDLEQGSEAIAYEGTWEVVQPRERRASRVTVTDAVGASAELRFHGTGIEWTTVVGPNHGMAAVWVDGRFVRAVDTWAEERDILVRDRVTGLTDGPHVLRIVALGRPGDSGATVAIDAFRVL